MTRSLSSRSGTDPAVLLIAAGAVVASVALAAIALGPMLTILSIGIPAAVAATMYAVRRPLVMLVAMIVIEVTNLAGVLAERSPVSLFHVSLGLGLLTVGLALRDPAMRSRLNRITVTCAGLIACYLITQGLAAIGSQDLGISMTTLRSAAIDCVFLLVVLVLAQLSERPWAFAAAVVVPLAGLSLLALINQVVFGGTATFGGFATVTKASGQLITTLRQGGPLPDSNFWGRHLILGLPLAGALTSHALRSGRRLEASGWAGSVLAILAGIYLTQSRGTLIAAGLAIAVWVIASGPAARRRGLVALPLVVPVLLLPGIGNRLVALLTDVSSSGVTYGVDPSVLGRTAAQEIAWAMFRDRPMFGFGPGIYPSQVPQYAGFVDTAVLQPTNAPHNLYAELAAESGIVGLVGWTILIGGFLGFVALRLVRVAAIRATSSDRVLTAAVLAALLAWSVASVFLHLSYFRTLAVMFALAGALGSTALPATASAPQWRRHGVAVAMLASVLGAGAAAAVLAATATETHTASQRVTVVPTGDKLSGLHAYALDIRSREELLPTFAGLVDSDNPAIGVVADPVRGVITLTATGADESAARVGLDSAVDLARWRLNIFGVDSWYTLSLVGEPEVSAALDQTTGAVVGAVVAGAAAASTAIVALRRRTAGSVVPTSKQAVESRP